MAVAHRADDHGVVEHSQRLELGHHRAHRQATSSPPLCPPAAAALTDITVTRLPLVQRCLPWCGIAGDFSTLCFVSNFLVPSQVPDVPHPGDTGLTEAEALSHFGLWCMMASPLWLTYDIFHAPPGVHEIVTNIDALKINQDTLGQPAVRIDGAVRVASHSIHPPSPRVPHAPD